MNDDKGIEILASVSGIGEYVFDGMAGELNLKFLMVVLAPLRDERKGGKAKLWTRGKNE